MSPVFPLSSFTDYATKLQTVLQQQDWTSTATLATALHDAWRAGRNVFLCGNGGSAANAIHVANDFLYPIAKAGGTGIRVSALPANSATLTCLANDVGYEEVFAAQLATDARPGDLLIVFSGSGNSPNIIRALEQAKASKMKSFAVLGYSGGACKQLADVAIHFPIDDMQIAEDVQLIVGHMLLRALSAAGQPGNT